MQVRVEGNVIVVEGAEDEVTLVFKNTSVVAIMALEHDDETDDTVMLTNVVGKLEPTHEAVVTTAPYTAP